MNNHSKTPKISISVLIPIYNDRIHIKNLIESLKKQNIRENFEIIFIDNNSTDNSLYELQQYKGINILSEKLQGSYAARNTGIKNAKGDILAFTDSDCIVDSQWLNNAYNHIKKDKADLVTGKINFIYRNKTIAEIYDSIRHLNTKISVQKHKHTFTANLIVKKKVFVDIGLFPYVQSGGDIHWTNRAAKKGYNLKYFNDVIVHHPARSNKQLLKKQIRVGTGHMSHYNKNKIKGYIMGIAIILKKMLPFGLFGIRKNLQEKGIRHNFIYLNKLWIYSYICGLYFSYGIIKSIINDLSGADPIS